MHADGVTMVCTHDPLRTHDVRLLWNSYLRPSSSNPRSSKSVARHTSASPCSSGSSVPMRSLEPSVATTGGFTDSFSVPREPSVQPCRNSGKHNVSGTGFSAAVTGTSTVPAAMSASSHREGLDSLLFTSIDTTPIFDRESSPDPRPVIPGSTSSYLLPPVKPSTVLTVVFDLDETLVYNRVASGAIFRPYAKTLLKTFQVKEEVELVLWTASCRSVAERIVEGFQESYDTPLFDHIISRNEFWHSDTRHTKDLELLGRPMDRVVIVENSVRCCVLNPENAIIVGDYRGDCKDESLVNVYVMIEEILRLLNVFGSVPECLKVFAEFRFHCELKDFYVPDVIKQRQLPHTLSGKLKATGEIVKALRKYQPSSFSSTQYEQDRGSACGNNMRSSLANEN